MKLAMRARSNYKKVTLFTAAFVLALSSLTASVPFILSKNAAAAPNGNTIVRATGPNAWTNASVSGGTTAFIDDATAPYGKGALEFKTNSNTAARAQRNVNVTPNIKLSDVTQLSYYTKYVAGSAVAAPALQLSVNGLNGTSLPTTLVYEPYYSGTVDQSGNWQQWNLLAGGKFWSTESRGGLTKVNGGGYDTNVTLAQVIALNPNAKITNIKLNVGTWNTDWNVRADGVNLNGTIYDFETPATPAVIGENFNTHSGADYEGINVGFNIADFGTVTDVSVKLYQGETLLATNTSNPALLALINGGTTQLSTPFITTEGTYVEEYWNLGAHTLTPATKPTKAVVSVTGANGTREATLGALVEPNEWNYETLFSVAKPVHQTPAADASINTNDFYFEWSPVEGAVSYEIQNSQNPAVAADGSFTDVTWTGDYLHIQPTEPRARSLGANGTWYWQVRAVDAYGNKSEWTAPWKVTIDLLAPTVNWQLQPLAVYTKDQGFAVRPITNEVGTLKSIYFDTVAPENLIRSIDSDHKNLDTNNNHNQALWNGLSEGKHKFVAVFTDRAGNTTISTSNEFLIDRTGPTITVKAESLGNAADKLFRNVSFKLYDLNKVDKVVINGVEKNLTDSVWSDVNGVKPGTFGGVEGPNTIVAYDIYGNTTTYTFTIDTTAPTVVSLTHSNNNDNTLVNTDVTSTLTFNEAAQTPAGWTEVEGSGKKQFTKVSAANNKGTLAFADIAGNTGSVFFEVKRIDKVAPVLNVEPGTIFIGGSVSVIAKEDNIKEILVNGTPVSFSNTKPNYTAIVSGNGTYTIIATDKAGNSATTNFVIDDSIVVTLDDIDLTVENPVIAGSAVYGANGAPAANTPLRIILDGTTEYDVVTDENGNFSEEITVGEGEHTVTINRVNGTDVPVTQLREVSFTTTLPEEEETDNGGQTGGNGGSNNGGTNNGAAAGGNTNGGPIALNTQNGTPAPLNNGASTQDVLGDSTDNTNANETGTPEVEGASTQNTIAQTANTDGDAGRLFGLAWYWWLLILAGATLLAWWIIAAIRRRNAEEN